MIGSGFEGFIPLPVRAWRVLSGANGRDDAPGGDQNTAPCRDLTDRAVPTCYAVACDACGASIRSV